MSRTVAIHELNLNRMSNSERGTTRKVFVAGEDDGYSASDVRAEETTEEIVSLEFDSRTGHSMEQEEVQEAVNQQFLQEEDAAVLTALDKVITDDTKTSFRIIASIDLPVKHLRSIVQFCVPEDLNEYSIVLRKATQNRSVFHYQKLPENESLASHCNDVTGDVQYVLDLDREHRRLQVLDVVMVGAQDLPAQDSDIHQKQQQELAADSQTSAVAAVSDSFFVHQDDTITASDSAITAASSQNTSEWYIDTAVSKMLNLPDDPLYWTPNDVRRWIQWASREFKLKSLSITDWNNISGEDLLCMSSEEFHILVGPADAETAEMISSHFEILVKRKCIAVPKGQELPKVVKKRKLAAKVQKVQENVIPPIVNFQNCNIISTPGNRTGNNGQIQLWQFLLELLTDFRYMDHIKWVGNEGQFFFKKPSEVAEMWGNRKGKPNMNYEKLSRAMRYYYEGNLMSKVTQQRFTYQFSAAILKLIAHTPNEIVSEMKSAIAMLQSGELAEELGGEVAQYFIADSSSEDT